MITVARVIAGWLKYCRKHSLHVACQSLITVQAEGQLTYFFEKCTLGRKLLTDVLSIEQFFFIYQASDHLLE